MVSREIVEGEQVQGVDEKITYSLTTTPWGTSPSAIAVKAYDVTLSYTDVTATVMPVGVGSAVADVITLPELTALTESHLYRIEVKFVAQGNTFEAFFIVRAMR
jgi:hypothetical protein